MIDTVALVAALEAEYLANVAKLAALPAGSVSSMGRSITVNRKDLTDRQKEIEATLAGLGSPIGDLGVPFAVRQRVRAT